MKVPFIDLNRSTDLIKTDVARDWQKALDTCEFVGGPTVTRLESELAKRLNVKHVIACANGTDALMVALKALGVGPGMKVALPNFNFWAPYEAIVLAGAVPVLIDIDENDLQTCFKEFCQAYDKFKFQAAILGHLLGWTSTRLPELRSFCQTKGIKVVDDSAQAYGVKFKGESIFSGAAVSTLSFYPAKVLGAAGDAGAVTCQDESLATQIRSLCNHGRAAHYSYSQVGWNSRMGGLQAMFLSRMLEKYEIIETSRAEGLRFYAEFFENHKDLIEFIHPPRGVSSNSYLAVFISKKKSGEELGAYLRQHDVGFARTYPETLDMQPPAKDALRVSDLRRSKYFCKYTINLPLFAHIRIEECEYAAQTLLKAAQA